jgi:hypothetical protein
MVVAIIGSCSIVFLAGIILLLGCLFRARTFRTLATQPRRKIIRLGSFSPKQFSVNQLRTATENFTHPLGSGAFGTVYKVYTQVPTEDIVLHIDIVLSWPGNHGRYRGGCKKT